MKMVYNMMAIVVGENKGSISDEILITMEQVLASNETAARQKFAVKYAGDIKKAEESGKEVKMLCKPF